MTQIWRVAAAVGVAFALNVVMAGRVVGTADDARADFSGTWTIDRGLSNDAAQVNFDAPQNRATSRGGVGGYGGRGGFGGRTGSTNRDSNAGTTTTDERTRLAALTEFLKTAYGTLVISHHEPNFVVNDANDHTWFLHTTGVREEQQAGAATLPCSTRWVGERLVTEFTISSRRTLVYTYTLLPATKQMVLRVRLDVSDGPRGNGSELKLVYRLAPAR